MNYEVFATLNVSRFNAALGMLERRMLAFEQRVNRSFAGLGRQGGNVFTPISAGIQNAERQTANFNRRLNRSNQLANTLTRRIGALASAFFGLQAARGIGAVFSELQRVENQLGFVVDASDEFFENIIEGARRVRGDIPPITEAFSQLRFAIQDPTISDNEVLEAILAIQQGFAITGQSTQDATRFFTQFFQAAQRGFADIREYRAFLETNPRILRLIQTQLGLTAEEMINLADRSNGTQLAFRLMFDAIISGAAILNEEFQGLDIRLDENLLAIRREWRLFIREFDESTGVLTSISGVFGSIATGLQQLTARMESIVSILDRIPQWVVNILPALGGLAGGAALGFATGGPVGAGIGATIGGVSGLGAQTAANNRRFATDSQALQEFLGDPDPTDNILELADGARLLGDNLANAVEAYRALVEAQARLNATQGRLRPQRQREVGVAERNFAAALGAGTLAESVIPTTTGGAVEVAITNAEEVASATAVAIGRPGALAGTAASARGFRGRAGLLTAAQLRENANERAEAQFASDAALRGRLGAGASPALEDVGLQQGILARIQASTAREAELERAQMQLDQISQNISGPLTGALHTFVETGEIAFDMLGRTILANLASSFARSAIESATSSLAEGLFGGIVRGAAGGAASPVPFFNQGGSFIVGGRGGIDRNLVPLRLSRGERVTVENERQQRAARESQPQAPVNNIMVVNEISPAAVLDVLQSGAGVEIIRNEIQSVSGSTQR